jgi:predicted RNA binding protein YcfA (HicA-like mRNA interferase family)
LGKLRVFSGSQVCAILAHQGFSEVRRRGSHIVMQKAIADTTITVPIPDHDELRIGTLRSIIRQSGVPRSEFEADRHGPAVELLVPASHPPLPCCLIVSRAASSHARTTASCRAKAAASPAANVG